MTRDGLPTGAGTAAKNDVADPHPATEEHYEKTAKPDSSKARKAPDIGQNSYAHDGKASPRPRNKGSATE